MKEQLHNIVLCKIQSIFSDRQLQTDYCASLGRRVQGRTNLFLFPRGTDAPRHNLDISTNQDNDTYLILHSEFHSASPNFFACVEAMVHLSRSCLLMQHRGLTLRCCHVARPGKRLARPSLYSEDEGESACQKYFRSPTRIQKHRFFLGVVFYPG